MYHFFTNNLPSDGKILITGSDVNHIKNVLRLAPGEKIVVSDGSDYDYYCIIESMDQNAVTALIDKDAPRAELPAKIVLYQGLPKSDKLELIIQKATELGAAEIVPVVMNRSIVKLDEKKATAKTQRWNLISESAAKQSGRSIIPKVYAPVSYDEALLMASGSKILLPYEGANGMSSLRNFFDNLSTGDEVSIFIGPEGGFEESEVTRAINHGAQIVSLGKRILRTETAGMALISAIMLRLEIADEDKR